MIAVFTACLAAAVDQSVIDNAMTSGVDVFAHVWVQAIVVTNVINVIYNFDKNGLSKVIYAEKVIYLFSKIS